jgi:Glycosyl hydrolase family 99
MLCKKVDALVTHRSPDRRTSISAVTCVCLLLLLSACQSASAPAARSGTPPGARASPTPTSAATSLTPFQFPSQAATPTATPVPVGNPRRPVLAFYYMWYAPADWCLCHMSDLPSVQYNSSDAATIGRQVTLAAHAGITGFISSWWGPGDKTDRNFARLLAYSATLEASTGYHFASAVYIENNAHALLGTANMINALRYVIAHYTADPHYLHWHSKPVIFFTSPIVGNGRALSSWAYIRGQVDPQKQMIWSAEGVDTSVLSVFDGIHLFSAGYWGVLHGDMAAVDQEFRDKINAYDSAHHTQKIWAAGVLPGYDDTRVPGRKGTYVVPRQNGATYRTSWLAAIASNPDWVTITTFNEWYEGAMIEPSVHYGNLYLDLTAQYTKLWQ